MLQVSIVGMASSLLVTKDILNPKSLPEFLQSHKGFKTRID